MSTQRYDIKEINSNHYNLKTTKKKCLATGVSIYNSADPKDIFFFFVPQLYQTQKQIFKNTNKNQILESNIFQKHVKSHSFSVITNIVSFLLLSRISPSSLLQLRIVPSFSQELASRHTSQTKISSVFEVNLRQRLYQSSLESL